VDAEEEAVEYSDWQRLSVFSDGGGPRNATSKKSFLVGGCSGATDITNDRALPDIAPGR